MFNDIDKKLRITWIVNIVLGVGFVWFTRKFAKVAMEFDEKGRPSKYIDEALWNGITNAFAIVCVVIGLLSLWVCLALAFNKCGPFKWLKKLGKTLRLIGWISLLGGWAGTFCYCFWCFFHMVSDNPVVNAISYTFIAIVPCAALVFCFAAFWYGLGNAADGGDATYVQNSKLYGMETLHGEEDTRKRCPDCGTRTDRHSCPNCGAWIE